MREGIRTVILLLLLMTVIGFIIWTQRQNQANLQTYRPSYNRYASLI